MTGRPSGRRCRRAAASRLPRRSRRRRARCTSRGRRLAPRTRTTRPPDTSAGRGTPPRTAAAARPRTPGRGSGASLNRRREQEGRGPATLRRPGLTFASGVRVPGHALREAPPYHQRRPLATCDLATDGGGQGADAGGALGSWQPRRDATRNKRRIPPLIRRCYIRPARRIHHRGGQSAALCLVEAPGGSAASETDRRVRMRPGALTADHAGWEVGTFDMRVPAARPARARRPGARLRAA